MSTFQLRRGSGEDSSDDDYDTYPPSPRCRRRRGPSRGHSHGVGGGGLFGGLVLSCFVLFCFVLSCLVLPCFALVLICLFACLLACLLLWWWI